MKKILTDIRTLAALLMASASLAACSSDDNIIDEQPVQPTEQVYTMTVSAAKGGDAADSHTTTRALSLDDKTLNAAWAEGERVTVYNVTRGADLDGYLEAQAAGASTTLKGELTGIIAEGDRLTLKFLSPAYNTQDGTLTGSETSIDRVCDYAEATVTVASVAGGNITVQESAADFQNRQAIVKFTLRDKADGTTALQASRLTVSDGTSDYTVTPSAATDELFVALPGISSKTLTLSAAVGSSIYTYERTDVTFADGQYYAITVKMTKSASPWDGSLTVEALTDGTVKLNIYNSLQTGMKYSVNGGEKTLITKETNIPVSAGDRVQLYGDGTNTQTYYLKIQGSGEGFKCKAYGNIMSLLDETNFATKTDLPNETLVFSNLFDSNTALTDASELLLPATTLSEGCYYQMFYGCTALTAAPALPATTLAKQCYYQMFRGCTALTEAPVLPATTLVESCYYYMFNGCSSLNYVRCLATSGINSNNSTYEWLNGVAATGRLYPGSGATWPENSTSGIPSGWKCIGHALSSAVPGEIIGSDGMAYAVADKNLLPSGVTGVAIVAYVGSEGSVETGTTYRGLAIAMRDANNANACWWYTANSGTCVSQSNDVSAALGYKDGIACTNTLTSDSHTHAAATLARSNNGTAAPNGTSGWFLPSAGQWQMIVQGMTGKTTALSMSNNEDYKAAGVNTVIAAAGGTKLQSISPISYWSSTEYNTGYTWFMDFDKGRLNANTKANAIYVRAVLAF